MGEDTISRTISLAGLSQTQSQTAELRLHGWMERPEAEREWQQVYGADLPLLDSLAATDTELSDQLHPRLPFEKAEVVWAARCEMARTVEDVLARRTRALLLDARASIEAAPIVARLLAQEFGFGSDWQLQQVADFGRIAAHYVWSD